MTDIHDPKLRGIYCNMVLVYSTLIYTCKYKCVSNNSTAIHILQHGGKSSILSENSKISLKKGKKDRKREKSTKIYKNKKQKKKIKKFFTTFENGTFIHVKGKHFS